MPRRAIETDGTALRDRDAGKVHAQALWLFGFANSPHFGSLLPDAQQKVYADFEGFIQTSFLEGPKPISNQVKDCHTFLRKGVRALLAGQPWSARIEVKHCLSPERGSGFSGVPKNEVELFRQRVLETISAAIDRLSRCLRRGCPKLFFRTGKQQYCTPRCAGKARLWKHRAKKKLTNEEAQQ